MSQVYALKSGERVLYVGVTSGSLPNRFAGHKGAAAQFQALSTLVDFDPFSAPYQGPIHRMMTLAKHKAGLLPLRIVALTAPRPSHIARKLELAAILLYRPPCNARPCFGHAEALETWIDQRQADKVRKWASINAAECAGLQTSPS